MKFTNPNQPIYVNKQLNLSTMLNFDPKTNLYEDKEVFD
jgi:hypothetical protein